MSTLKVTWPPGFSPGGVPSTIANLSPVPSTWPLALTQGKRRPSGVLMLFFLSSDSEGPASSVARVLFIKRSSGLRSHRGQVGFPGGRADEGESSPAATVLRECSEEIGLGENQIKLLGALPPINALDGSPVLPLVGACTDASVRLVPSPEEVADIFFMPWTSVSRVALQDFSFTVFGRRRSSPWFPGAPHAIWGLTAKILESAALEP